MKFIAAFLLISLLSAQAKPLDSWEIFARVKFSSKFFKELNEFVLVPFFDSRIKAYEGKEITLHYEGIICQWSWTIIK